MSDMPTDASSLAGRVAIVTGGGAGIGRGVARALAARGAAVAVVGRRIGPLEHVCADITEAGGRALPIAADVGVSGDVQRFVDVTVEQFGRLDVLVNNAQGYRHAFLLDATDDDMDLVWRTGPLASFRSMKAAYPHLLASQGLIVNFGSGTQLDPSEQFHATYNAAKGAIANLTRSAAVEWGKHGIRAVLVLPAAESDQLAAFRARDPRKFEEMMSRVPLGRFGDPELDIGRPIAWMATEEARFITGTIVMLDGEPFVHGSGLVGFEMTEGYPTQFFQRHH
jgi:NAD(P)-dependent dehydrogenase (short-subunit alcohol dehydrogenase family)